MLPAFFIAHGSPSLAIEQHAYTEFLHRLVMSLPKPKAIVVFSAHWESAVQKISSAVEPEMMYDFSGYPEELYDINYPAKGDLTLSLHIQQLFQQEGIRCELNDRRGLDHGAWAPLSIMYPHAQIPVVTLSVNPRLTPEEHYRIGAALSSLRDEQVLIIGSGGTVHNLRKLDDNNPVPQLWAVEFDEWLEEQLETWNLEALIRYDERAPHAREAVPTPEHFVPLLVAMGAGDATRSAKLLHHSFQMGTLSLCCWMFGSLRIRKQET
ncbi:DODA-type extradiol aromatic ring-opening family dioxygenase [Paenibacillus qinlingensis]|uniref:DODA-type extradiol aromatic ring-opening family dioxygenase n=1 Tax=Paenibacillus qinlingensis TaxID=1837343 RepID=UPI0015632185|nr:class III extradiol ring-cleavage dioxygenase [Paenibacillus qinlingensis]NQX62918.1 dioxygenase [Paenibacillus qinlingensis]